MGQLLPIVSCTHSKTDFTCPGMGESRRFRVLQMAYFLFLSQYSSYSKAFSACEPCPVSRRGIILTSNPNLSLDPPEMNTNRLLLVSAIGLGINLFGMLAMGGHAHHGHSHSHGHGHDHGHGHNHHDAHDHMHNHSSGHCHDHGEDTRHEHDHPHSHVRAIIHCKLMGD